MDKDLKEELIRFCEQVEQDIQALAHMLQGQLPEWSAPAVTSRWAQELKQRLQRMP